MSDQLEDDLAASRTRAVATADRRARELGVDVAASLITITQESQCGDPIWRIVYGPKQYVGRRGGDLTVEVDARDASIRRVLKGQ